MHIDMDIVFPGGADEERVDAIMDDLRIPTGGEGQPSPFDLFLASIGTCAGVRVLRFCQERGIPAGDIRIRQRMTYNEETSRFEKIALDIQLPPDFPAKYQEAVVRAAHSCGVKKHLLTPPEIEVRLSTLAAD